MPCHVHCMQYTGNWVPKHELRNIPLIFCQNLLSFRHLLYPMTTVQNFALYPSLFVSKLFRDTLIKGTAIKLPIQIKSNNNKKNYGNLELLCGTLLVRIQLFVFETWPVFGLIRLPPVQ